MKKLMMLTMCVLASGVVMAEPVEFRDYDANTGTFTNAVRECTFVMPETRTLSDGWYVVKGAVSIGNAHLAVNGHAKLILCDGSSLTVNGDTNHAGIEVLSNNTLSIYGQANGTGRLALKGGYSGAGIGSGKQDAASRVTAMRIGRTARREQVDARYFCRTRWLQRK